jgi:hypothetical protein
MPDRLLTTLQQHALFIRRPQLCTYSARALVKTKTGHEQTHGATSNGYILREIRSSIPDLFSDDDAFSPAEESAFHIFALQARPTGCYICDKDDHRLFDCGKLKKILDNPGGRRALRSALAPPPPQMFAVTPADLILALPTPANLLLVHPASARSLNLLILILSMQGRALNLVLMMTTQIFHRAAISSPFYSWRCPTLPLE